MEKLHQPGLIQETHEPDNATLTYDGPPFVTIPEALLFDTNISSTAVRLYGVLVCHGSTPERCWPGRQRLGELIGLSARSVNAPVRQLEATGWVTRHQRTIDGKFTSMAYTVHYEAVIPTGAQNHALDDFVPTSAQNHAPEDSVVTSAQNHAPEDFTLTTTRACAKVLSLKSSGFKTLKPKTVKPKTLKPRPKALNTVAVKRNEDAESEIQSSKLARVTRSSPLPDQAQRLAVIAFEQEIKPAINAGRAGKFPAVKQIMLTLLEANHDPERIIATIKAGVDCWTTNSFTLAMSKTARQPQRQTEPQREMTDVMPGDGEMTAEEIEAQAAWMARKRKKV